MTITELHFILYYISLHISLFTAGIITIIYLRNRHELVKLFFYFFCTFTLFLSIGFLKTYFPAVFTKNGLTPFPDTLLVIGPYVIMLIVTLLLHSILTVSFYKYSEIVIILYLVIACLVNFLEEVIPFLGANGIIQFFEEGCFIVLFIYQLVITIVYFKNLDKKELKHILLITLVLLFFTVPALSMDVFEAVLAFEVSITVFIYLAWALISLIFLMIYHRLLLDVKIEPSEKFLKTYQITGREKEIMLLIIRGFSYKKIGDVCFISLSTVRTHAHNIYKKTGASGRHELSYLIRKES